MKTTLKITAVLAFAFIATIFASQNSISQTFKLVSLTGGTFDASTREPISVSLTLLDETGKKLNTVNSNAYEKGYYFITGLKPGKKYFVLINQPGYFKEKIEIPVHNSEKYFEISKDFYLKPLKVGSSIPVAVSPFEPKKSKIRQGADESLTQWIGSLTNNPNVKFEIRCYADNNNSRDDNKKITEDRAKSLKDFFVKNGIDESYIVVKGMETTDPVNPPPTEKRSKGKNYIGTTYIVVTEL